MLTKNKLKEIFSKYDFAPLKRLGENYLIDGNIKDKIIAAACLNKEDTVLEIGPGLGALTFDLAGSGARVFAVEKDRKACVILKDMSRGAFPDLKIFNEDILKFDLTAICHGNKIKVVGALPYYITTPIIEYLIGNKDLIESVLMTVQKEVAGRISALPGSEHYSALSCFVQYHAKITRIHTIRRTSFYPVPEVDSSLLKLDFLQNPPVDIKDEKLFFKIIRGAFNQRRKSIVNSLSRKAVLGISKEKAVGMLANAGIDPSSRPESLSLSDFAAVTNALDK